MKVVVTCCVVAVSICCLCEVSAPLPDPQSVIIHTLNTQYVLKWAWPQEGTGNQTVTFTAQYLPKYKVGQKQEKWITVCVNTTKTECDFSGKSVHYHGLYVFRVRASSRDEHSAWVQRELCPDISAVLGPPSEVVVTPTGAGLTLKIYDPMANGNISMRELDVKIYYLIKVWKSSRQEKVYKYQNTTVNLLTLSDLKPWTVYCVQVQSRSDFYNKASIYSPAQCTQTKGQTPFWQIFLPFLISMVTCFLCVVSLSLGSWKFYRLVKSTFFPPCDVPSSLQEPLYDSPSSSDHPSLLTLESEVEICLKKLEVFPKTAPQEVHVAMEPAALLGDALRHERQSSGDSGVYSAGERSGQSAQLQDPTNDTSTDSGLGMLTGALEGHNWKCDPPGLNNVSKCILDTGSQQQRTKQGMI